MAMPEGVWCGRQRLTPLKGPRRERGQICAGALLLTAIEKDGGLVLDESMTREDCNPGYLVLTPEGDTLV